MSIQLYLYHLIGLLRMSRAEVYSMVQILLVWLSFYSRRWSYLQCYCFSKPTLNKVSQSGVI